MKQKIQKIVAIGLSLGIVSFFLCFLCFPKHSFSEHENRYLATFPKWSIDSFFDGTYMEKVSAYLTDHFPFRNILLSLKTKTERTLGKTEINHVYFGSDNYLMEAYQEPKNTEKIVQKLNNFCNQNKATLMLIPTSISINSNRVPRFVETKKQQEELKKIYEDITCQTVNLDFFYEQNEKTPLYYRLDHHFNSYGAYYASKAYIMKMGNSMLALNDYNIHSVSNDFRGTLDSKVNDPSLPSDTIVIFDRPRNLSVNYVMSQKITTSLYEPGYLSKKDKYSYFLDNNHPLIVVSNLTVAKKEILIVKDSYANSMVPFFTDYYSKVHIIDPRFYQASITDYLKEHPEIEETLMVYNMNTLDSDLGILTIR